MNWHIDYLTLTVFGSEIVENFDLWFADIFASLVDQGHGGRFYYSTYRTDPGIVVRTDPVNALEDRATIEIPGTACQMLGLDNLSKFFQFLCRNYSEVRINRIDVAFDHCNFSVNDVFQCIRDDNLRSYFKRSTVKKYDCPYEENEEGEIGTSGITIGGRSSTRYMRIYDKHGYTRLEVEYKAEKADQVGADLLTAGSNTYALKLAMGHLRDYVDFFEEWWDYFISNYDRLYKKLPKSVQEMTKDRIRQWFESQIASAFYVLASLDEKGVDRHKIYNIGRQKYKNSKYFGILEMEGIK